MTPPSPLWRNWLYGVAWLAGGVAALFMSIWLVTLIRWDWPAGTEAQRLTILGNALYGVLAMSGLVTLGLTMRSAIRNFKGTAGGISLEANSGGDE